MRFAHEFLRVQADKFLLAAMTLGFVFSGKDHFAELTLGALLTLITANRFQVGKTGDQPPQPKG